MKAQHSSTSSSDGAGRRALIAGAWAAVLLVAFDLTCSLLLPEGFLLESEDRTRERAEHTQAPDIQIVGDSVVRSGMMPGALSDGTLTSRNDGMAASGPPKTYLLLARQFESGRVPSVLVIAHSPHTFGRVRFEELIGSFTYWREIPGLVAHAEEPWTEALYGVLTRFSYTLRHRSQFRQLITDGNTELFKERNPEVFVSADQARLDEFRTQVASGSSTAKHLPARAPDFYWKQFKVTRTNDVYFRKILALARQYGVEVFWITMPVPTQVRTARSSTGYDEAFHEYLQQFAARGELTLMDGEAPAYPDEFFSDWLHLNLRGAVRFACELESRKAIVVRQAKRESVLAVSDVPSEDGFARELAQQCSSAGADQPLTASRDRR